MSAGSVLSRVFSADTLTCTHCGSAALYPYPGLFGELGGLLGRMRYACRDCRRHTWLRPGAEFPQPDEPGLQVPGPSSFSASLEALDIDVAPLPPPRTDLRALDEELARSRRRRKKH